MALGKMLAKLKKDKQYTYSQMAGMFGMKLPNVCAMLGERYIPSEAVLEQIAFAIGVSPEFIKDIASYDKREIPVFLRDDAVFMGGLFKKIHQKYDNAFLPLCGEV